MIGLMQAAEQSRVASFFQSLTWQDWATALGLLFGILSLIAYIEQRRATKSQQTLIEFTKRHLDKDITEEQLQQLSSQKLNMERQIAQAIPALARSAVLREQLSVHARALAEHYKSWRAIRGELDVTERQADIDPAIRAVVEDKLLPSHEVAVKRDELKTRLTIFGVASGLAATLPSPVDYLLQAVIAIPLALTLISLIQITGDTTWLKRLSQLVMLAYAGLLVAGFWFSYGLLFWEGVSEFGRQLGVFVALVSFAGLIGSRWLIRWLGRLKANGAPNRVGGGFSPPPPTPPSMRVRTGRFTEDS